MAPPASLDFGVTRQLVAQQLLSSNQRRRSVRISTDVVYLEFISEFIHRHTATTASAIRKKPIFPSNTSFLKILARRSRVGRNLNWVAHTNVNEYVAASAAVAFSSSNECLPSLGAHGDHIASFVLAQKAWRSAPMGLLACGSTMSGTV